MPINPSTTKDYPLSFTGAALLPQESAILAELYGEYGDWEKVYAEVADNELFNRKKEATRRRLFNELSLRLRTLGEEELAYLAEGNEETRRLLLWQAVCRAYPFVANFVRRVLRPKLAVFDYRLRRSDYLAFWREEAEQHPRLDELTESTQEKLQSRLYYLIEQAGILVPGEEPRLQALLPPPFLCTCVRAQNPLYLEYWLLSDAELKKYATP